MFLDCLPNALISGAELAFEFDECTAFLVSWNHFFDFKVQALGQYTLCNMKRISCSEVRVADSLQEPFERLYMAERTPQQPLKPMGKNIWSKFSRTPYLRRLSVLTIDIYDPFIVIKLDVP